MKKILQSITIILMLFFVLSSVGIAQEPQIMKLPTNPGPVPEYTKDADGEWIKYWQSGVNDNALGLGGDGAQWFAAIRWMPAELAAYEGYSVTKIRIFMNDEPLDASVVIWQGNPDLEGGEWPDQYVSQSMMVAEEEWVEVELFDPYLIDTSQELWIGWEIGDPGDGVFPAAFETSTANDGLANLLQFGTNPWQFASAFGFETVWNIEAFVIPGDVPPDPDDEYSVTFNVDMSEAEGFDPDQHSVFVTGSFTDWAEPGSEGSLEMTLVDPAKNPPYTFYENFDGYADFTTDLSPWITIQLTEGNTWGVSDFSFPGEGTEFAWMAFNPAETDPPIDEENPPVDGSKYAIAIQYTDFDDNKWLISPEFSAHESSVLSFHAMSYTAAYGLERIRVLVSTTGDSPGDFIPISDEPFIEVPTQWTEYTFPLGDYDGEVIRFAINYVSEDAFIFMLDAISLTADVDPDPPGDVLIYTATHDAVPAGTLEYKYFSDAFGAGWDGGEWEGDPNREEEITGDTVLNDVWGVPPVSVVEVDMDDLNMVIYPNPASSVIHINTDADVLNVKVYDITGRLVMQQSSETSFNVSQLKQGLYIMQIETNVGVQSHRFHIAR